MEGISDMISLADRLSKLFGQTAETTEKARRDLKEHPARALKKMGFTVEAEVIKHFEELDETEKMQIVERFERVSRYNTDFRENHSERIIILKELKPAFESFLQWEEPPEEERAGW
jgi:Na+/phosphate symporter